MTLFRARSDFDATVDAAAARLGGINAVIVEKDYWVSQVLHVLAEEFPDDFVFKGGTSLSKCYRLIRRFSEDVDLLILPNGRGTSRIDTLMKDMVARVGESLGSTPDREGGSTGKSRRVRVAYPTGRSEAEGISSGVLLEMGIRGSEQPHEILEAGCLLADAMTQAGQDIRKYDDLRPVRVPVLHPGRTLLEKLAVIHTSLSGEPGEADCQKHGRHYYDIHQLLGDDRVRAMLNDRPQVEQVIASIQDITDKYFTKPDEHRKLVRPEDGWASSTAFDASNAYLAEGYTRSMELLSLDPDGCPTFADICARVRANRDLL